MTWTGLFTRRCRLALLLCLTLLPVAGQSQEPTAGANAPAVEAPPPADAPPPVMDAPPPVVDQPVAGAPAEGEKKKEEKTTASNFLVYVYQASPTFFILIGAMSVVMVAIVINNFRRLRLPNVIPPATLATLDQLLGEKKYKEAYEVVKRDPSLFGRAVAAGVERLSHGLDRGMDALLTVAADGKMEMEHNVSLISTFGAIGPMLGLLGTVMGMINAFQEISLGGAPRPAELANQIGLALCSTLEGIMLAVPSIIFFAYFRNRIARLIFEVETVAENYLFRFAAALKK